MNLINFISSNSDDIKVRCKNDNYRHQLHLQLLPDAIKSVKLKMTYQSRK